jgi:hypothetical protein
MASKRPHPDGPMDHRQPKQERGKGGHDVPDDIHSDDEMHIERNRERMPELERQQDGDRSKRLPVDVDAESSRGDPPHGYGTEAPQVQGGGKR